MPRTVTAPASGSRIPARIESRVVFPAPFGPITASSSPGAAVNETSRSAARPSKRFETALASITEVDGGAAALTGGRLESGRGRALI